MAAGIYNITIEKGDTYTLNLTSQSPSGSEGTLVPDDLTGYTATGQIRSGYNDPSQGKANPVIATFLPSGSFGPSGNFTMVLDKSTTTLPVLNDGVYDIFLIDADNRATKFVGGRVKINPSATKL